MNRKAKELNMGKTVFRNPHGLANILNVSSAKDMLTLSKYCYDNKKFREIMNKEEYKANFYEDDMEKVHCCKKWVNTNKLLSMGWEGIKTGQTQPAGACLASVKDGIFIIVLNSANR
jgi:D-alanyl-D-alanine carboxypeptidase